MNNPRISLQEAINLVSVLVVSFLPSMLFAAGEQTDGSKTLEEIVVEGTRLQNRQDIALKKSALVTFDSLSSEEAGKAPDFNIADAFRRIPGVSTLFDEDEGRFVVVRGINPDLNFATIDGLAIATIGGFGDGSRRVNLEAIPSTAVSRLEVFKTFTPDIDASAAGGYLNLVTRSAFESSEKFITMDVAITENDFDNIKSNFSYVDVDDDKPGGRAQFTLGDVFGADDQFGYVVSGTWNRKHRDEEKVINGNRRYYDASGATVSKQDAVISSPDVLRYLSYNNEVERGGVSGKFEFRTASLYTSLSGYFFTQEEDETRYENRIEVRGDALNQTASSVTLGDVRARITTNYNELKRENSGLQWHLDYVFDDKHKLSFAAGQSTATFDDIGVPAIDLRADAASDVRLTIDTSGPIASYQLSDNSILTDPSLYRVRQYREEFRESEEEVNEFKLDFVSNYDVQSQGFAYKVGAGYREFDRTRDNDRLTIVDNLALGDVDASRFIGTNGYTSATQLEQFRMVDYDAFIQAVQPFVNPFTEDSRTFGSDFKFVEETFYTYGLLSYATDSYRVTAGLRYDDTEFEADTFRSISVSGPELFVPVKNNGGYDNILPSLHFTYNLTDDLRLRASYSETLGRPNPDQVATGESINETETPPTLSRGNPDLKPRQVQNFDVSTEYYFQNGGGIASVGIFRKNIQDDIFVGSSTQQIDGVEFDVTQPLNATDSKITGVEANFIMNRLSFLPTPFDDFGVSANITLTDGELNFVNSDGAPGSFSQLLEQPETLSNVKLFYNRSGFDARLSYNLQGKYLSSVDLNQPERNRFVDDFEQVDFRVSYTLRNGIKPYFDVRNLTDEKKEFLVDGNNVYESVEFGRVLILGVNYTY